MKTNHLLTATVLLLSVTSCDTYYRITSRIEKDGSMYREVYAQGDSAFRAGDMTHNPFLFEIDADWQVDNPDSAIQFNFWGENEKLNAKVTRKIPVIDGEYFSVSKEKEYTRPLAVPHERLKKNFRWFYTYYIYTATYQELPDKGPVPLGNYLNEEEQTIWLRGDNAAYDGLNGIELNDKLDNLEAKFGEWYQRSMYEISWEIVRHFTSQQGDTAYVHRLDELKDAVYNKFLAKHNDWENAEAEQVCNFFDKECQTEYFSKLYKTNKGAIDAMGEEKIRVANLFYHAIQFEVTMPGRILSTNARTLSNGNTAIWKIDGFRLLAGDYVLRAESRIINYWTFAITLLAILAAFVVFVKRYRRKA